MERSFLENLGLDEAVIREILDENDRDIAGEAQRAEALEAELAGARETLAGRDYADALYKAAGSRGLKFTSRAAERDFIAQLREQKLELKDGELLGLDGFIQAWKAKNPDAFASDRPQPRFAAPAGLGSGAGGTTPANVAQARAMGAGRAAALKSSREVMKNFL